MCHPAVFLAAGLLQGQADAKQGEEEKQLYDFNADAARFQAQQARKRGAFDVEMLDQHIRGVIGAQRAAYSGQGVVVDAGSALDLQIESEYLGSLDATQIVNNAELEAYGYQVQASGLSMQGHMAKQAGKDKMIGDIVGGAAKAYGAGK